uniref:FLZ-type domain-containing protein n=1 Tax=Kalanchoe fedtschenkoi TaxID=63787 RepID=A0A7N0V9L5_KALFE
MGVDHFSKSLIEGSTANAFETYSPNPLPPRTILTCSSTPSSLLSPASHIPQIGSPPAMQPIFEPSPNYGFDLNYYHFTRNNESYQNSQSAGSDVVMGSAAGSEASLFSSGSSEYIFGSLDDIMGSQIALQEEYTRVVSRGANPMTTHIYNNRVLEARPDVGGLSATFGNAANRPPPMPGFQYPTAAFMSHCNLCRKPLDKERNDIFIFKGEYAYCGIPCRQVDIDMEEERDKAEIMAQKQAAAKRLASYGKSPVLFEIGRTSSS